MGKILYHEANGVYTKLCNNTKLKKEGWNDDDRLRLCLPLKMEI